MSYKIEDKLVIAVSSSALFDLSESDKVFRKQGAEAYKTFQKENMDKVLDIGVAYPFIRRFLSFNKYFPAEQPVEVVLLSRNSTATGQRVFRSIGHYGLALSRARFLPGESPFSYIPALNASLLLPANEEDLTKGVEARYLGFLVLPPVVVKEPNDNEFRPAFDFLGVWAEDEA